MQDDLQGIISQLKTMLDRFEEPTTAAAPHLNAEDRASTRSLLREAKAMLDESLGRLNEFSTSLLEVINEPAFGIYNPPTREKLLEGIAAVEGGLRQLRRKQTTPSTPAGVVAPKPAYVDPGRIAELESLPATLWDTRRLVRMLQEINTTHANELHMATAMLLRAICDHVPPIFGKRNFAEVASNVAGKSISSNLRHLENSLRNIADTHLHAHIRQREVLPTASQVDFRQDLDVLLQEVVRIMRP
jgi:hypothetical protein